LGFDELLGMFARLHLLPVLQDKNTAKTSVVKEPICFNTSIKNHMQHFPEQKSALRGPNVSSMVPINSNLQPFSPTIF
jgi:hypothetical protein